MKKKDKKVNTSSKDVTINKTQENKEGNEMEDIRNHINTFSNDSKGIMQGERNNHSGEEFQQWSINDTQDWFYRRSTSKESRSSGSSGIECSSQPSISKRLPQRPQLQRYISGVPAFQQSIDSNDKDLILPMPPLAKFSSPAAISKNNMDPLNAEKRRKYYQNRDRKYGRNLNKGMNHGYFFLDRSGSAEHSSLSEPDLTRNVKSLPEACSYADKTEPINCTTSIPEHFDSSSSGFNETTKFIQPPPSLLRAKRFERKSMCPLHVSRSSSSLILALKPESNRSSLLMALKPETSLPNIENGCFMDVPMQQKRSFYPPNTAISQLSIEEYLVSNA